MDKQSGDAFEFGFTLQAFPPPATKCSAGGEKSGFVEIVSSRHSRPRAVTMASPAAAQQQRSAKIAEYERFIGERLRPDLEAAERARDETQRQVLQWEALEVNAKSLREEGREEMRTLVDLGSQVYCQAEVPDTSRVFVNVGLGFHAEMDLDQAEERTVAKMLVHLKAARGGDAGSEANRSWFDETFQWTRHTYPIPGWEPGTTCLLYTSPSPRD